MYKYTSRWYTYLFLIRDYFTQEISVNLVPTTSVVTRFGPGRTLRVWLVVRID